MQLFHVERLFPFRDDDRGDRIADQIRRRQAFVVLAATLSTVGTIPVASVALILGVHRLLSEGLTPTNLIGNAVATIVISKWEKALDMEQLHRVLDRK